MIPDGTSMRFQIGKFFRTLRICWCVLMAKTFGRYDHSGLDECGVGYAQYEWRGRAWRIPSFNFPPSY